MFLVVTRMMISVIAILQGFLTLSYKQECACPMTCHGLFDTFYHLHINRHYFFNLMRFTISLFSILRENLIILTFVNFAMY